jgi:hypothetical protein
VAGVDLGLSNPRSFAAIHSLQSRGVSLGVPIEALQSSRQLLADRPKPVIKIMKISDDARVPPSVGVIIRRQGIGWFRADLPVGHGRQERRIQVTE